MNRINVLDEITYGKIAAGEVIERPYSVVKELIENSIDASSKNIIVSIQEGGQKYIKITDNGKGIHPDDIEKAFLPHATSKIKSVEDIFSLNTMGFRGEALASIASVAKVTLKTRINELDYGKEIKIEGGIKKYIKDAGLNVGTSIEVEDLFYNVPARKKFLKSVSRETSLITDIVTRLSLANSNIAFSLYNNDKKSLLTYGNNNLYDTIRQIYGKDIYENVINFEGHNDIATVYGYIGNSEISRNSRNKQSIFINKRYIKSGFITAAVENAFKSFLTINKFPFFVLFLDIYPEFVDVNVHPTKSEVKFTCDNMLYKLVFDSVHKALADSYKNKFIINEKPQFINTNINNDENQKINVKTYQDIPTDLKNNTFYNNSTENNEEDNLLEKPIYYKHEKVNNQEGFNNIDTAKVNIDKTHDITLIPKFGDLNIIGQFNNTYIIAEYNKELYIIDQHAAHEKILFEKYTDMVLNDKVIIQVLAVPLVLELTEEDFVCYNDNVDTFKKLGFRIDNFGINTIRICEVPVILGDTNFKNLFFDILDDVKNMGNGKQDSVKYNKLATTACKAAVKANMKLSTLEMKELINTLRYIREPFTCPHGRPTIIKITLNELEKKFKRIQ